MVDPELVIFVRPFDWDFQSFGHVGDSAGMVHMAVSDQNFCDCHALFFGHSKKMVDLSAGVDKGPFYSLLTPD